MVWLATLICVNLQTSFLTPPFGWALFFLRGVAPPEVTTGDIYRGIMPFVAMQLIALVLCFSVSADRALAAEDHRLVNACSVLVPFRFALVPGAPPIASTANSMSTLPAFSKVSDPLTFSPFVERPRQAHHHDVKRAGLELDRRAGAIVSPSLSSRIFITPPSMLISWTSKRFGDFDRTSGQAIGRRAGVGDFEIAARHGRVLRRGARPGMIDRDGPAV